MRFGADDSESDAGDQHVFAVRLWFPLMEEFGEERCTRVAVWLAQRNVELINEDVQRALLSCSLSTDDLVYALDDAKDKLPTENIEFRMLLTRLVNDDAMEYLRSAPAHVAHWMCQLDYDAVRKLLKCVPLDRVDEVTAILDSEVDQYMLSDLLMRDGGVEHVLDTWRFCVEAEMSVGFFEQMVMSA